MRAKILSVLIALVSCFALNVHAQDASLYMKYANKGDKEAMYNLAGCYWSGNGGVTQDYSNAFYWYEKSAKKNYQPAQHMTALCYLYGIGTTQNWRTAWDWAEKAIKKGFGPSNWIKAQIFKEGYMSNLSGGYLRFLTEAANSGYAKAQSELGVLYLKGSKEYGVEANGQTGYHWVKQAAEQEDAEGLYYLGVCYDAGVGVTKDHDKALEYIGQAAQLGYADAQAMAGYCFLIGDSVDVDYSTAYQYFKAAAEQDNAYAYGKIGDMYYYGLGVEENNNTAMDMYKAAAKLGDKYSMCQLAYMYGNGIGASEDHNLMYQYYKQAADLDYAAGQCGVGDCYMYGYGVSKSEYSAFQWYQKAANQDNGPALLRLAHCYLEGLGTSKNSTKFIETLEKAASLGNTDAKSALAYEYYSGENVKGGVNYSKAIKLYKEAAEEDDAYSQAILGYYYYKGEELVSIKDYNQAFMYLTKAVRNTDFESLSDELKANIYRCLAGCYRYGRGCEADQSLASYYTEQSAKFGDLDSQRATGLLRKNVDDGNMGSPYSGSTSDNEQRRQSSSASAPIYVTVSSTQIETDSHKWTTVAVEVRDDCTYVYKRVYPKTRNSWVFSSTEEFIEDAETGQKYYLTNSTIGVNNNRKTLQSADPYDFTETYPALPKSVRYINISSGSQYYAKNVKIR